MRCRRIQRRPKIGPQPPSEPTFDPQWGMRTLERDMLDADGWDPDELEWEPQCRLCACTHSSPCEGGCGWAEGDLCTLCVELREAWPILWLCDGYGIAASWAFAPEPSNESNALA